MVSLRPGFRATRPILACTLLCACLAGPIGCQSGRPAWVIFSDDGGVVAYRDWAYPTVYVADARGARAVGEGDAVLSASGRYLLLIKRGAYQGNAFGPGSRMTLYDVRTRERYTTTTPDIYIPFSGEVFGSEAALFFDEGPVLKFGLGLGKYAAWDPKRGWYETTRPRSDPERLLSNEYSSGGTTSPDILVLRQEGWNARRTVWVRPDGSVRELLRQNEILPGVLALIPLSPMALVPGYNGLYFMGWHGVFCSADPIPSDRTEADLRAAIEQRRRGATQPSSRRAEDRSSSNEGQVPP